MGNSWLLILSSKQPGFWIVFHRYELADDAIVGAMQLSSGRGFEIAALHGEFEPDRYKKGDDNKTDEVFKLDVDTPTHEDALERGRVLAEAHNFSRDIYN